MNERILEFAKEAGHIYHVGGTVPYFEFSNNQMKKFAQLIVEECIQAIQNEGQTYEHLDAGEFQANNFSQAVKQHFGVEE